MTTENGSAGRRFIPLALGLGVMIVAGRSQVHPASAKAVSGLVRCEIEFTASSGGVEFQGAVFANAEVEGRYQLQVGKIGGGRSNINQGGAFKAGPDAPARLGKVTLGGDGGSYSAKLKVMWDGEAIECEKTVVGGPPKRV